MEVRTALMAVINHTSNDAISELERQLREERRWGAVWEENWRTSERENTQLQINYHRMREQLLEAEDDREEMHQQWVDERIMREEMSCTCNRQAKEIKKLRRLLRIMKQCKKNRKQQGK